MENNVPFAWYIDDNKASKGKKHTFLGMHLQITEDKKIEIEMEDQPMEAIELFREELEGEVTSPNNIISSK